VFQAIGGKRLCHGRIQYYEVENQPEFPGAGERNRTSDLRVTRTRRQRIPSHIQQFVAPSINSDINFDGTLPRNIDTTLMPLLYRLW
jgi:hypothetical protein